MGQKGRPKVGQNQDRGIFGAAPVCRHCSEQQLQQHQQQQQRQDGVPDAPRSICQVSMS